MCKTRLAMCFLVLYSLCPGCVLLAEGLDTTAPQCEVGDDPVKTKLHHQDDWVRKGSLGDVPPRLNELYPLSDQDNSGQWVRYELMWDEFDGKKLDSEKWWDHHQYWLGRQPSFFCPNNIEVRDSRLHITMKKEECPKMLKHKDKGYHTYTSACVQSKTKIKYGYIEIKAKPMDSAGSSSFWLQQDHSDWIREIDVFEIGGNAPGFEYRYNMNLHQSDTGKWEDSKSNHKHWIAPFRLADDYHVYGLEWNEKVIKWYVDGVVVRRVTNHDFHHPLWLKFDSETMPDWLGLPEDDELPSTYKIKYVRTWKRSCADDS